MNGNVQKAKSITDLKLLLFRKVKLPTESSWDRPGEEQVLVNGSHKRVIMDMHPGFGKTRKVILRMVKERLAANRRITLLAPTRVVMGEMAEVLAENSIKYETSSGQYGKALIVVMCHATFMNMILSKPAARNVNGTIVMDEAHFLDCRSIAARGVMEDHYMRGSAR